MKTVGERIRQAREAQGWSGLQLAQKVGYSHQSSIGNLENRAGGTGGSKIAQIAEALNVPVQWLLQGPDSEKVPFVGKAPYPTKPDNPVEHRAAEEAPSYPIDPLMREALSLLANMSPAGRQESINYLRYMAKQHTLSAGGERDSIPQQKAA